MPTIEEILVRRTDLSTFLVHFTRGTEGGLSAEQKLEAILQAQTLRASTPFGPAAKKLQDAGLPTNSQRCVCFTETPLEHVSLLLGQIDNRQCAFEPYGVAITKRQGRQKGVNPIWYTDITPGHNWLMNPINQLIDAAVAAGHFDDQPIAKLAPFIEQMGNGAAANPNGGGYRKEFWWEREWRYAGDVSLPGRLIILCPQGRLLHFEQYAQEQGLQARAIDPRWSLEQIIGRLAGIALEDIGPF